jgi:glutathione S-transferase
MGVWLLGRLVYTQGYIASTQEQKGKGRYRGLWYFVAQVGIVGLAGWSVFETLRG